MTPDDVMKAAKILERMQLEVKSLARAEFANDHHVIAGDIGSRSGPVDSAEDRFTAAVKAAAAVYWRERIETSRVEVSAFGFDVSPEDVERGIRAVFKADRHAQADMRAFSDVVTSDTVN